MIEHTHTTQLNVLFKDSSLCGKIIAVDCGEVILWAIILKIAILLQKSKQCVKWSSAIDTGQQGKSSTLTQIFNKKNKDTAFQGLVAAP